MNIILRRKGYFGINTTTPNNTTEVKWYAYGNKTKKYIKRRNRWVNKEETTSMSSKLKDFRKYYSQLDIADLEYLKYKATKECDNVKLNAIRFVCSDKSEDSERIRQEWENRFMGSPITEEMIAKYGDYDDKEL